MNEPIMWIKCYSCGNDTSADLADCICEQCGEMNWSEPYPETALGKASDLAKNE